MPIDPNIALQVQAPHFADPIEQAGRVASLQNMMQNRQLNAERLRSEQLANQEVELKHKDDQLITQAYQQASGDPKKTVQLAAQGGARPGAVQALEKHFADIREQYAKTSKDESDVLKYKHSQLAGLTGQAMQDPNLAQNWGQYKQQAQQIDPTLQLPDQAPTPDQLSHLRLGFTTDEMLRQEADEVRKQNEENRKKELQPYTVREASAKAAGAELSTAMSQKQQDASTLAQAAQNGTLGQVLAQLTPERRAPFAGLSANAKPEDILRVGMTPEAQVQAGQSAKNAIETARHNQVEEGQGAGRLSVERSREQREQNVYNQTYGPGANQALVGVLPQQRGAALREAQTAANDFLRASQMEKGLDDFIRLARSGNKAAYANMPVAGVLEINSQGGARQRLNRNELEAYGNAGSLFDQIAGKLGKLTKGQSIPADVINDIDQLHQTIKANSTGAYKNRIDSVNHNYGSSFTPVKEAQEQPNQSPALSTGHKVGDVVQVGGKNIKITKILPNDKFEGEEVK